MNLNVLCNLTVYFMLLENKLSIYLSNHKATTKHERITQNFVFDPKTTFGTRKIYLKVLSFFLFHLVACNYKMLGLFKYHYDAFYRARYEGPTTC